MEGGTEIEQHRIALRVATFDELGRSAVGHAQILQPTPYCRFVPPITEGRVRLVRNAVWEERVPFATTTTLVEEPRHIIGTSVSERDQRTDSGIP